MDFVTLIGGLVLFTIACILDFLSSVEMGDRGIREGNKLVRGKDGKFSPIKGLVFIVVPVVVVLLVFFLVPQSTAGYDRVYAPLVLLPGAALHFWAYLQNKKLIAEKKANTVRGGIL